MKICIVSDSHDNRDLLAAAVAEAAGAGARAVLHCGDVVAPSTLEVLRPFDLPVHVIHGNNSGDLYMLARIAAQPASRIVYHGQDAGLELGGRRVFLVHYPHYAQAMAGTGDWDLVCCGHDHVAGMRRVPNLAGRDTLLVNPGTVGGIQAPATWVLGDLESMQFSIREVGHAGCERSATWGGA